MEIAVVTPGEKNGDASNTNALKLWPVAAEETGEGLPYAPENWPEPGDVWGWRTGRRVALTGHFLDRYLYLPTRLCRPGNPGSSRKQRLCFPSRLSAERYVKTKFPEADIDAFFASFSWKIPAIPPAPTNGDLVPIAVVPLQQISIKELTTSDIHSELLGCKASNKTCNSVILEKGEKSLPAMPCDICCGEPGFCRDCCCILCCQTVDSAYGGYSYIKCQEKTGNNICGHIAHVECALRSRMAGTVGGSIGLNTEYHCRRCDRRTDLISQVNKLLQTCKNINSRGDIEKILNLGACLLRGTQKAIAMELLSRIELAISKLKCGTHLEDIWKVDGNHTAFTAGFSDNDNAAMEDVVNESPLDVRMTESYDGYLPDLLKLEVETDQVLQALRKSQELEYQVAEERLHAQKNYLKNLYRQLDSEKSELACQRSSYSGVLSNSVRDRNEQIKQEFMKLKDMGKIANGFGRTPKDILKKHFGLKIED